MIAEKIPPPASTLRVVEDSKPVEFVPEPEYWYDDVIHALRSFEALLVYLFIFCAMVGLWLGNMLADHDAQMFRSTRTNTRVINGRPLKGRK